MILIRFVVIVLNVLYMKKLVLSQNLLKLGYKETH